MERDLERDSQRRTRLKKILKDCKDVILKLEEQCAGECQIEQSLIDKLKELIRELSTLANIIDPQNLLHLQNFVKHSK